MAREMATLLIVKKQFISTPAKPVEGVRHAMSHLEQYNICQARGAEEPLRLSWLCECAPLFERLLVSDDKPMLSGVSACEGI